MNQFSGFLVRVSLGFLLAALPSFPAYADTWQPAFRSNTIGGKTVALGNLGSQVFAADSIYSGLFSAYDTTPPTPIWLHNRGASSMQRRVAAARNAKIYAVIAEVAAGTMSNVVLSKYSSSSELPEWTKILPTQTNGAGLIFVAVNNAGDRIVTVVYNTMASKVDVAVFSPTSPTPTASGSFTIAAASTMSEIDLSADGQKLAIVTQMRIAVISLQTMALQANIVPFEDVAKDVAISGDGSLVAVSTTVASATTAYGFLKVYQFNAATGQYDLRFNQGLSDSYGCDSVDISDDGSTLAAGCNNAGFLTVYLKVFNLQQSLASGQLTAVLNYPIVSTGGVSGTMQNFIANGKSVRTSANGKVIAIGVTGDGEGPTPEVLVFDREQSLPIATFNRAASSLKVDLSADGRNLLIAGVAPHIGGCGVPGTCMTSWPLDLYSNVGDLKISGTQRAGSTITVKITGPAGASATILTAQALAGSPQPFNYGMLYLQRSTLATTALGVIPASGVATISLLLAPTVGQTIYVQGFRTGPRRLLPYWLPITIVP